nr:MAG TPA: HNH endonuclease [Crassvirales sp.]
MSQRKYLQLLCPNCHALTDSYRGKNIKKIY